MDKIFLVVIGLVNFFFIVYALVLYILTGYDKYSKGIKRVHGNFQKIVMVVGPLLLVYNIINYALFQSGESDQEAYDRILYEEQSAYEDANYDYGSGTYDSDYDPNYGTSGSSDYNSEYSY